MIQENGHIVAIDNNSVWVATIKESTCSSCSAEKGCGQGALSKYTGNKSSHIRVLLEGRNSADYHVGDQVALGIPEDIIVKGSLLVYLTPLVGLIIGATLGANISELLSMLGGFLGFLFGAFVVRLHAFIRRNDRRAQPVLIDELAPLHIFN